MCEDFGCFGDESFLDEHNFQFEQVEIQAMAWQDEQDALRQMALDEQDEDGEQDGDYQPDDCPLDGDAESALASCGWGTDEDYGYFGGDDF